jgi:ATP-dependent protease HslVU (ClpYQ) peptidase subunit
MTTLSPREIVSELDRYSVGQKEAKRAVARVLVNQPIGAEHIVRKAMAIAGEICLYTGGNLMIESIETA